MFTYSQLLEYILEKCIFVSVLKSSSRDAKNKAHIKVAQFLLVESEVQLTDYGQSCGDLRKHKMNVCMLHLKKKVLVTNICKQWICSLFIKDIIHHIIYSAQRVPEPDPIPGISFDTRPDPIQF